MPALVETALPPPRPGAARRSGHFVRALLSSRLKGPTPFSGSRPGTSVARHRQSSQPRSWSTVAIRSWRAPRGIRRRRKRAETAVRRGRAEDAGKDLDHVDFPRRVTGSAAPARVEARRTSTSAVVARGFRMLIASMTGIAPSGIGCDFTGAPRASRGPRPEDRPAPGPRLEGLRRRSPVGPPARFRRRIRAALPLPPPRSRNRGTRTRLHGYGVPLRGRRGREHAMRHRGRGVEDHRRRPTVNTGGVLRRVPATTAPRPTSVHADVTARHRSDARCRHRRREIRDGDPPRHFRLAIPSPAHIDGGGARDLKSLRPPRPVPRRS